MNLRVLLLDIRLSEALGEFGDDFALARDEACQIDGAADSAAFEEF